MGSITWSTYNGLASIHSSVSPVTTHSSSVTNIIDGDFGYTGTGIWLYYQNGDILRFPLWAIIDLGQDRPIDSFEIHGISFIWGGGSCPRDFTIATAEAPKDGTVKEEDFELLWASSMPEPFRGVDRKIWRNEETVAIIPRMARYIKISIDSTWDVYSDWMGLAEVAVYGEQSLNETVTILSDAEITTTSTIHHYLYSDAYVDPNPIIPTYTDEVKVFSNAYVWATMSEISSVAHIYGIGMLVGSLANISNSETQTIISDAHIKQRASYCRNAYIAFPGEGPISDCPEHVPGDFVRPVYIESTLNTTSIGTIVADMFTSTIIDLSECAPPFGYQNYDWSYDWVARTTHNATYLVEVRVGDTLGQVNTAVFTTRPQGYRMERGSIPRYHQYRLHVWASGSGDFEFHQFTVRAHVINNINTYYRSLISDPFLTTNVVDQNVNRTWEPNLDNVGIWQEDYIPGDLNGDGIVTGADVQYFIDWVFSGTQDAPADIRVADVNGDGTIDVGDIEYLINWISGSGPPPRIRIR